jgi:hypothetical protein
LKWELDAEDGEKEAVVKIAKLVKMRLRVFGKLWYEIGSYLCGEIAMETE